MQCVRCQHQLPARADRCVRCFALNPRNAKQLPFSELPRENPRPVPVSFDDGPEVATEPPLPTGNEGRYVLREARRSPLRSTRLRNESQLEIEIPAPEIVVVPAAPAPAKPETRPGAAAPRPASSPLRLLAAMLDGIILAATLAGFVVLATAVVGAGRLAPHGIGSRDYWLDLLLSPRLPLLWSALAGALAVAYSSIFALLGGRTPGLALFGMRLVSLDGGPLALGQAFLRAAWALPSAALGLFGFLLALFDARGQTLHDKIARSVVVPDVC